MVTTRRVVHVAAVFAVGLLVILPGPAPTQPNATGGKDTDAKIAAEARKADDAMLKELASVGPLIEFGKKYKVAEAFVDAGGILLKFSHSKMGKIEKEPTVEVAEDAPKQEAKTVSLEAQAEDLFDEARGYASNQKAIEAAIRAAKAKAKDGFGTRGVQGGPKKHQAALPHKTVHKHHLVYTGNQPASICFQSTTVVMIQVVDTTSNFMVWNYQGTAGQFMWNPGAANRHFTVLIGAPVGPANYLFVTN